MPTVPFSNGGEGTVTVPAGAKSTTFTMLTFTMTTQQTVVVSAALNGTTISTALVVNPASGSVSQTGSVSVSRRAASPPAEEPVFQLRPAL